MTGKRRLLWILAIPVTLLVLAVGGTWVYINLIKEDPPDRLTLDASSSGTTATSEGAEAGGSSGIEGAWKATAGSEAGYRAKEVLFGQSTEGVGRTSKITGEFVVTGTAVTLGVFEVDMASVTSDESKRDNQYRGRIMDVAQFPTSKFVLSAPIELGAGPSGLPLKTKAVGDLTLRGRTKRVTLDLEARLTGGRIEVAGSHPITWSEWGIPNPTFGPAEVEDDGLLEFKLVFAKELTDPNTPQTRGGIVERHAVE